MPNPFNSFQSTLPTGLCLGLIFAAIINNLGIGLIMGLLLGLLLHKGYFNKNK